MALVPYTITALAESDAQGTDGKNIVAGATCSMYSQLSDSVVTLYDDAAGSNGSTSKVTGANGQVVVYVEQGRYRVNVNASDSFVTVSSDVPIDVDTFANLAASSPVQDGQRFICQERASANYILQPSGYAALAGDVTFANGRVAALQIDSAMDVRKFGASTASIDNSPFVMSALSRCLDVVIPIDVPLGQPVVMDESGRTISGQGGFSYVTSDWSDRDGMINVRANDCTVKDIYLDAEGSISTGRNIRLDECDNTLIYNVTGRGAPQCFVVIHDNVTNTFVRNCKSFRGYGILVDDAQGSSGLYTRGNIFDGANLNGDGIEVNTPNYGFNKFQSFNDTARNYTGVAINQGLGIGLEVCSDFLIVGFECENLENDGIHFEDGSNNGVCTDFKLKDTNTNGAVGSGGILIKDCDNLEIGCGIIEGAQNQHGITVFQPSGTSSNISMHDIEIRGCGRSGLRVYGTENSSFKNITIIDANQLNTGNYGMQTVNTNTNLSLKGIKVIDGTNPVAQGVRFEANSITGGELSGCNVGGCANNQFLDNGGNVYSKYGNIKSLTDTLTGTFSLAAASTSTIVSNENCSNDENDITIIPKNASAANLGSVYVTFSDNSGFTLGHASATGTEEFAYRINV